jgi:hypothetical protein
LLRNIGIAGAVVWAAPVLTSLPASASTDGCRKKRAKRLCKGIPAGCPATQCGTCGSFGASYCFEGANTITYCAEDFSCGNPTCSTDADCKAQGAGNLCIINSCCGSGGVCSSRCCTPLTGAPRIRRARRLGKTGAGY